MLLCDGPLYVDSEVLGGSTLAGQFERDFNLLNARPEFPPEAEGSSINQLQHVVDCAIGLGVIHRHFARQLSLVGRDEYVDAAFGMNRRECLKCPHDSSDCLGDGERGRKIGFELPTRTRFCIHVPTDIAYVAIWYSRRPSSIDRN